MGLIMDDTTEPILTNKTPNWRMAIYVLLVMFFIGTVAITSVVTYLNAPGEADTPLTFTIEEGMGAREATVLLEDIGATRSAAFLYLVLVTLYEPTEIKASTYVLDESMTAATLARTLVTGDFGNDLIRFTHIEGQTSEQLADSAAEQLKDFDRTVFLASALPLEGRLFPDTYFIPADYTAEDLIGLLTQSFEEAILPLQAQIEASDLTLDQILILASILEREANTPESKGLVSSVLQNRIAVGMPLQADASIEYVLDKPLSELTPDDLKIDSPYNTYTNPGLPPTPIGNPGLTAIEAVLSPTQSPYFFYITGKDGEFYYAETYDEHLLNIERYLR